MIKIRSNFVKIALLLFLSLSMACSKDDNKGLESNHVLVGTWMLTDLPDQTALPPCLSSEGFVFRENGTCEVRVSNYSVPCETQSYQCTYTVNGDILTIIYPNDPSFDWDILLLNGTKLQLRPHNPVTQMNRKEYTRQ